MQINVEYIFEFSLILSFHQQLSKGIFEKKYDISERILEYFCLRRFKTYFFIGEHILYESICITLFPDIFFDCVFFSPRESVRCMINFRKTNSSHRSYTLKDYELVLYRSTEIECQ